VLASLGGVLGNIVFDIGLIDSLVKRILEQMTILPRLASALSLAAGAVIIANTVSLATLERKREIGIMKALGLKGKRVLGLLLLENGIIGVTSGIIGVVIGAIPAILIGNELTQGIIDVPLPVTDVIGLLLLALVIALGATLLTAYGASRQKPLTVLRYE
jgi:putative ABC transport system permease protein